MNKIVKVLFFLGLIPGLLGSYYFYKELESIKARLTILESQKAQPLNVTSESLESSIVAPAEPSNASPSQNSVDMESLKTELMGYVDTKLAALPPATSSTTKEITTLEKESGTTYIPMGSTSTTQSTGWITIEDTAVYVNAQDDYGESAVFSWSASLKVAHGNGQAFARLYDATHGIAVDGSEISTTNNVDFQQVSSGSLPFWRGTNLYKVQIKSLNSFVVTISNAKIKVSY